MEAKYSKLGFTLLALTVMIGSSFLVFGDVRDVAKDEGFHETLYVDVIDRADASGNSIDIFQDLRFVDNTSTTDFYDISVGSGELSFQESGTTDVLTLSNSEVKVQGSDGLCFGGTCVSNWPSTCGADEAVSWDSGAQEFNCMNISDKIDNEVTPLSAGDAIRIDASNSINVKYGDGLTLIGDTLTIDSSACGSGEVLNYTSSGFTCVSVSGGGSSVNAGQGLTLIGDTLTIDSSACGSGEVLNYTSSGFTCVSVSGGGSSVNAGQGLQKTGSDIDVGAGDGISTSADTTSVDWNDANDLDSNGDVVASRIISGDDTSVNEIWVDDAAGELCYKTSDATCDGYATKICSAGTDTIFVSGAGNPCDEADSATQYQKCYNGCTNIDKCNGQDSACSESGTYQVEYSTGSFVECGLSGNTEYKCDCALGSDTNYRNYESSSPSTLCVAGS